MPLFGEYYHVATRRFCCCLPVRIGVLVLSALSAVIATLTAYGLWLSVISTAHKGTVTENMSNLNSTFSSNSNSTESFHDWQNSWSNLALDKTQYYVFIVAAVVATIYALFSLFGFVGTIFARRALVAFYSTALWILLVVNIVFDSYNVYSAIHRRSSIVAQCLSEVNNPNNNAFGNAENKITASACNAASKAGIVVAIVIVILQLLIQLYACVIVKRYVEQLGEEQGYRRHLAGNRVGKGGDAPAAYYAHQPLGGGGANEMGPYPYAQKDHSYGAYNG